MQKIMVVDDHTMFRQAIISKLITCNEVEVIYETGRGEEAIIFAERLSPDIVIMDISLPDIDGIEASKKIIAQNSKCSIILLSMYKIPDLVDKILDIGIKGYVLKNDAYEDLLYAIKATSRGKIFISTSLQREDFSDSHILPKIYEEDINITPREREILSLIADGFTSKEIGKKLFISTRTVETHRARLMEKLGCRNIAELVKKAIRLRLISF